jgi:hypothetical protein
MFIRVVALLLAIIVLWTGLNTIELRDPAVLSPPQFSVSVFHPGGPPSKPQGSVEHHHLDDQPSQSLSDPHTDMPILPQQPMMRARSKTSPTKQAAFRQSRVEQPFLSGPLRPPCCAAMQA